MYEIQCFDSYGNTINNLTQWDIDQSLVIPIDRCNLPESELPSSPSYVLPEVHFSNKTREDALVVRSEKNDDSSIKVTIPNILLQDACPLQIYVYMTDSQDTSSQKTILHNEVPVRKRQKPSDYFYVENIDRITAEMIKEEIEMVVNEERQAAKTKIKDTTESAIKEVDNQMDKDYNEGSITTDNGNTYTGGFVNVGNDIITELDGILKNSKDTYDNTIDTVYGTDDTVGTVETITTSLTSTMNEKGLSIKPVDNGNGNIDIAIIITPSEES